LLGVINMGTQSISQLKKNMASLSHNNREYLASNIDPLRVKENVYLVQIPLAEAYEEYFGPALARYNAKQTREDRKIKTSYFEHLFKTQPKNFVVQSDDKKYKQNSFYEDLVQIGSKEDFDPATNPKAEENCQKAKAALLLYWYGGDIQDENGNIIHIPSYQERNPGMKVFNCTLHMDEASPHMHIDYIPVATGFRRGMDTQNGYNRVLESMGYTGANGFYDWRQNERDLFREICTNKGLDPKSKEEEQESRAIEYMPEQYRQMMTEAERQARETIQEAEAEAQEMRAKAEAQARDIIAGAEHRIKPITQIMLKEAAAEAEKIKTDAKTQAQATIKDADTKAQEIIAEADGILERTRKHEDRIIKINTAIDDAGANKITARIQKDRNEIEVKIKSTKSEDKQKPVREIKAPEGAREAKQEREAKMAEMAAALAATKAQQAADAEERQRKRAEGANIGVLRSAIHAAEQNNPKNTPIPDNQQQYDG